VNDIRKISFLNVSDTIENGDQATIIQVFRLRQNYPNPFNPSTTSNIKFLKKGGLKLKSSVLTVNCLKCSKTRMPLRGIIKLSGMAWTPAVKRLRVVSTFIGVPIQIR
jgi:hypothetical protein